MANVIETNACGQSAAIDRGMGMFGSIEDEWRMLARPARFGCGEFSRRKDRVQTSSGRRVVDDPEKIVR